MKMTKLMFDDIIQSGDLIKAKSSQKAVPVSYCFGFKVGAIDFYMEEEFDGFYRVINP